MANTSSTRITNVRRTAGPAAVFSAAVVVATVGFAGAAQAVPDPQMAGYTATRPPPRPTGATNNKIWTAGRWRWPT